MQNLIELFITYQDLLVIYTLLLLLNLLIDFSVRYKLLVKVKTPITKKFFSEKISFIITLIIIAIIELLLNEIKFELGFSILHVTILALCIYEIRKISKIIPQTFLTRSLNKNILKLVEKFKEKYDFK